MQYAHMNSVSPSLKEGQAIAKGTYLGTVGDRGFSFGTHAHFEVNLGRLFGTPINNDPTQSGSKFVYSYGTISTQIAKPSIAPDKSNAQWYVDDHNIVPVAKIYNPNRSKITTVGIQIRDGNTVIGKKEEQFDTRNNTAVNGTVWYNCVSECGVTLRPGHTYTWNIYAYVGGTKVETGWQSINTTGTEKPNKPVFTTNKKDYAVGDAATVNWSPDTNATRGYSVTISQVSGGNYTHTLQTSSYNATSLAFTLPYEGEYEITGYAMGSSNSDVAALSRNIVAHGPSTVKFVESFDDGTINLLCEQKVKYGSSAQAPNGISRKGHTFIGWDGDYSRIVSDVTVTARFKRNSYKVVFYDKDNQIIKTETVLYESDATAPTPPEPESGYVFAGWDNEDYKNVQGNTQVKACYVWQNKDLPVLITLNSCEFKEDGYIVSYDIKNNPDVRTKGRALASLKTSGGKLLDTTESKAFSLAKGEEKKNVEMYIPYEGKATQVSLYIIDGFSNGIPISATATINVDRDWSDWSGEEPDPENEIETRTEYRYMDKLTSTTRTPNNEGWALYNSVLDDNWTYGSWSGWSRNAYSSSLTETSKRDVETRSVQDSAAYTLYNWYYYRYWNSSAGTYYYTYSSSMGGTLFSWQTSYMLPYIGTYSGHNGYKPAGGKNFANEIWFLGSTQNVPANYHTEWRYRDATKGYTYYWYKWADWSDWSPEEVAASDSRQVETRTAYRYRAQMSDIEDNSGQEYEVSGQVDSVLAGKEALLQVYKGKEPSDSNNEYIGKIEIEEDGSYSHSFIPRQEVSAKTGDYTIMLAIEGATEPIYLDRIEAPKPEYTVTFKDDEGNIIDQQIVSEGGSATAPAAPEKEHYTFAGWDFGVTNVRDHMEITALYIKNKYSVAFVNWNTREVDTDMFTYGSPIVYPEAAQVEGYDFTGWTTLDGQTVENVVDNTVVMANYTIQTYTINFYDANHNLLSTQQVKYGEDAVAPEEPSVDKMEFLGWSSYEYIQAKGNLDIYPTYQYIETTPNPTCGLESGVLSEATDIYLYAEDGAVIYYTTDGTIPTILSNKYNGKITIDKNTYLQYMAVSPDKNESQVMNASYLLISSEDDEGALVIKRDTYNIKRDAEAKLTYFLSHENEDIGVEYYSLDENIASIDEEGNIRANQVGKTRIFVRTSDCKYADYCDVVVTTDEVDAERILLKEAFIVALKNSTVKVEAEIYPENATEKGIDWYVDDEEVAVVDPEGNVKIVGEGRTVLKGISRTGTCYAECVIEGTNTVWQETVYLSESILALKKGESKKLEAYCSGAPADCTWYSYDEDIATVDQKGNVLAVGEGHTIVSAYTDNGFSVNCTVIVEKETDDKKENDPSGDKNETDPPVENKPDTSIPDANTPDTHTPTENDRTAKAIKRARSKVSKVSAFKKTSRSLKVTWKKVTGITGYQLQYSASSKFKKAKTITIKGYKKTSRTIKKLKSRKKYYFRVRTYTVINSTKYYSKWSKTKSQKTK